MDNIIYWFDSLGHGPSTEMKIIFNMALKTYYPMGEKHNSKNGQTIWIQPKCPQQPGNKECGYYVIRYMYEIIQNGSTSKFEEVICRFFITRTSILLKTLILSEIFWQNNFFKSFVLKVRIELDTMPGCYIGL
ncbi:uncharacterized protein LOC114757523 [Neltuma alba]|uniref:uncharacterized protein LOC114757523 n=1 Tax=Neltuma alba TaxID=207710 RepID=UPI0010A3C562|nr:uncharacterized protein LOC114757523 [Prosopis alba]